MHFSFYSGRPKTIAGTAGIPGSAIPDRPADHPVPPPRNAHNDRWLAMAVTDWLGLGKKLVSGLQSITMKKIPETAPNSPRKWRLWQVESTIACNLNCVMCPWAGYRKSLPGNGHLPEQVWQTLAPWLSEVTSVDFSGGGEPLLQPSLVSWITQAKEAGCETGFLTNGLLLEKPLIDKLLTAGLDWIGISIDGADAATYQSIRRGSDFSRVCRNVTAVTSCRPGRKPLVMINFVIMTVNGHQLEQIIDLAATLGADHVNFKQCDVIRGEHGRGLGLFADHENKEIRQVARSLKRATRLARKRKIRVTAQSFVPDELPVCGQDPRHSLFIRHDGAVAPCINLAVGGPSRFLGTDIVVPTIHYGRLPSQTVDEIWTGVRCRAYRNRFTERQNSYDASLDRAEIGHDFAHLDRALANAARAMPPPPEGCSTCHYLFSV